MVLGGADLFLYPAPVVPCRPAQSFGLVSFHSHRPTSRLAKKYHFKANVDAGVAIGPSLMHISNYVNLSRGMTWPFTFQHSFLCLIYLTTLCHA